MNKCVFSLSFNRVCVGFLVLGLGYFVVVLNMKNNMRIQLS